MCVCVRERERERERGRERAVKRYISCVCVFENALLFVMFSSLTVINLPNFTVSSLV